MTIASRLRPRGGFSYLLHLGLNAILPLLVFILVRINFAQIALILILLSKWRIFAVRPRYWLANIRSNGVDIIVGLSVLVFMLHTNAASWQFIWAALYAAWLIFIKPGSDALRISAQSLIGQIVGLSAVFIWLNGAALFELIILVWAVCYLASRHFLTAFEENFTSLYAHTWGYFGASLTWILGHYLLYYGLITMPTLLLTIIGLAVGSVYYLEHGERINKTLKRQIILIACAAVVVVLVFSNWSNKIV